MQSSPSAFNCDKFRIKYWLHLFWILLFTGLVQAQQAIVPGKMITIPDGNFIMDNNNEGWTEKREYQAYMPKYQIRKYEITRSEYRMFIEACGNSKHKYWSGAGWKWKESNEIVYYGMYSSIQKWDGSKNSEKEVNLLIGRMNRNGSGMGINIHCSNKPITI
jgi:formylglycine-generating enzyme required for sulfatase activity